MNSQYSTTVTDSDTPSMTVIELVADATDTDPVELAPLYNAIDPDVIDSLAAGSGFSSLEFEYAGHTVVVEARGDELEISLEAVTIGNSGSAGVTGTGGPSL